MCGGDSGILFRGKKQTREIKEKVRKTYILRTFFCILMELEDGHQIREVHLAGFAHDRTPVDDR